MRTLKPLCLLLIIAFGGVPALAKEEAESRTARRALQGIWYGGSPKAIAEALEGTRVATVLKDNEGTLRLLMFFNETVSRLEMGAAPGAKWKRVAQAALALAARLKEGTDPRRVWARYEADLLVGTLQSRLGQSEDAWKVYNDSIREISRTEGPGMLTMLAYNRAFDLHARHLRYEDANFFSGAGGFVYLRAKMKFIRPSLSDYAIPVADAHRSYIEGSMALRGKSPDLDKARPKFEETLQKLAQFRGAASAPLAAVRLHNDVVGLLGDYPDLEMDATLDARSLDNLHESQLARAPAVEGTLAFAVPYSSLWRVVEGELGDEGNALHLLRTHASGAPFYAFTLAALDPKAKCAVPGSRSALKGSAHKSIASALAKAARRFAGSGAKVTGPKKGAYAEKLKGGWVYEARGKKGSVRGVVGKGAERTYVVEMIRYGAADTAVPADVTLFLERLALKKK